MSDTATLAFEIGTEEIPAFDLKRATEQLAEARARGPGCRAHPPRGGGHLHEPAPPHRHRGRRGRPNRGFEEVFRGPAAKIAFDEAGNPTKAAIGFARGKGLDVDALERRDENGIEYVFAVRSVPARTWRRCCPGAGRRHRRHLLAEVVPLGHHDRDSSRARCAGWWRFWEHVIPVEFAGLTADATRAAIASWPPARTPWPRPPTSCPWWRAPSSCRPSRPARRSSARAWRPSRRPTGFTAELPAKTLLEVVNLSEYPTVLVGTFDEEFLRVPEEIIVDAMLMHQRYFPLYDAEGKLTNKFIVVSNGDPAHADTITGGNERVVRARLSDAKFFYEEDLKQPLDTYVDRLDEVVFQEALGTMSDKTDRVVKLSARITSAAGIEAAGCATSRDRPTWPRPTW